MLRSLPSRNQLLVIAFSLLLAACAPVLADNSASQPVSQDPTESGISSEDLIEEQTPEDSSENEGIIVDEDPFSGVQLRFNPNFWPDTDFTRHSVDYIEIMSGGPPPDGIPAIDFPIFENINAADEWLGDDWPVMFYEWNNDARAYPLAILIHHEIVNDVVGDRPVTLTFCPLCNSTIAFDRTLGDGLLLDFGTTGNLRNSDLVMYDRQTHSWWQQFIGEAIVGELTGTKLEFLPSQIIAWSDFKRHHPQGQVLSRETGFNRPYGRNPYAGYDSINSNPFLFEGVIDGQLPAMERVAAIEINGVDVAYPFSILGEVKVINDEVSGESIVVFWKEGTSSIFSDGQETGSTGVFLRQLDDQLLTFHDTADGFADLETGSLWNILGEAISGPLEGKALSRVFSGEHFWFAWAAFKPDTIIWTPKDDN